MKLFLVVFVVLAFLSSNTKGLDNGLALTPPMGWMPWERFRCIVDCKNFPGDCISEDLIKRHADLMVSEGYLEAGYEYIIIDDCWMAMKRDEEGRLVGDPERFPSGMKKLADYVHNKGLKFGIYEDYGNYTCAGYPGSMHHLEIDAKTFAEWGVDYLKLDGCYSDYENLEEGYAKMGRILNATGRPIVYSCSWPAYQESQGIESNYTALMEHCNLWRNWYDIDDSWQSVSSIMGWFSKNQDRLAKFSGPGHWNDPDMLIIGNYGLSYEQSKSQMAIWAIMAAPLIMSVDLATINPRYKAILLNKNAIAINQDKLGIQGRLITTINKIDVWTKPILPMKGQNHSYAIAFMSNRVDGYPYRVIIKPSMLGMNHSEGYTVDNLFDAQLSQLVKPDDDIEVRVKPTGVVLLRAIAA